MPMVREVASSLITEDQIKFFLMAAPQHMEVPRLGVDSDLQLPAYAVAVATSEMHLQPIPQLMATLDP